MISRSSVQDALGLIFEPNANEEEIEIEQEKEEDVSEIEISIDLERYWEPVPVEDKPEVTFHSKDGNLLWYSSSLDIPVTLTLGPTWYATSLVHNIKSSFHLFLQSLLNKV